MTDNVIDIRSRRGGAKTLRQAVDLALTQNPTAETGIIVVFDDKARMHTYFFCNSQELAIASVRLSHIANEV
jgi:hypothetical protein